MLRLFYAFQINVYIKTLCISNISFINEKLMWNECTWMQQTKKASDITEQFKGTTVAKRQKKILSRKLTQQNNKKKS